MKTSNRNKLKHDYCVSAVIAVLMCVALFSVPASGFQVRDTESIKKQVKRAKKQMRKGLLRDSEATLRRALTQEPDSAEVKLAIAYVLLKQRRHLEGFEIAFRVAEEDPKNARAFAILGTVYLDSGRFAEARVLLSNAILLNKREALAWASLGLLDFYNNDVVESLLNLKEAVYRDRSEPDFEYALAQVSSRNERYKEAAESYQRFLRISPKSDVERRDRIKGLIRFLSYLGTRAGLYDIGGESKTVIKLQVINNRPIVEVRINRHKKPLRFVLDTGSGISVLSKKTAKKLGIRSVARGGLARALGGDGKFEIVYGFLNTVRLGEARVRNVPVYIREFSKLGADVDGYIGLSLISKFITTLDYKNETLSLIRKDDYLETPLQSNQTSIPLRLTSSGFLSGIVSLPGIESNLFFILDTGASVTVVSEALAMKDEIKRYKLDRSIRVVGAAGVTDNVPMFSLRDLSFGGAEKPLITAVALNLEIINETSGFTQAGIIGGNFLKDYKLTFDFKRSKVTLTPN